MAIVLYRGRFQGRRLSFLLDAIGRAHDTLDFVWLHPQFQTGMQIPWFEEFVRQRPWISSHRIADGSRRGLAGTFHQLRKTQAGAESAVYAIGFTSLWYARALFPRPIVWCIQGIPEEKLAHRRTLIDRASVAATWRFAQAGPAPRAVITVSERMAQMVNLRFPRATCIAAPTCVDLDTFKSEAPHERRYMTYLGSGAPWQNLGQLSDIWSALYRRDPSLRFKIVSRDKRAEVLMAGIPAEAVAMHAAHSPGEVARHLWESELGFLIRTPDIVNEVSFPTKFGEYVAAGVPIVTTDVGWDFSRIVRTTGCGLLVNWRSTPEMIAQQILDFRRDRDDRAVATSCAGAADLMNKEVWVKRLSDSLKTQMLPNPEKVWALPH